MISQLFTHMTRQRAKRNRARPKLPNRAERLYLGALRLYAKEFRDAVLDELPEELVNALKTRVDSVNNTLFRTDAWQVGPFKGLSSVRLRLTRMREKLPLDIVGAEVASHAQNEAERLIGLKNADLFLRGQVSGWRRDNVSLITKMSDEMLGKVQAVLDQYNGMRVEDTADALEQVFGLTRARSELIARDQTLKLNANMAQQSQAAAGVTHYRWSTSQDSSVREDVKGTGAPDHEHLNDTIQSWDEPPVTCEKTGARNHPGEDYQCRCVAVPVLEEFDEPAGPSPDAELD